MPFGHHDELGRSSALDDTLRNLRADDTIDWIVAGTTGRLDHGGWVTMPAAIAARSR